VNFGTAKGQGEIQDGVKQTINDAQDNELLDFKIKDKGGIVCAFNGSPMP
jgi:hypothetical protein